MTISPEEAKAAAMEVERTHVPRHQAGGFYVVCDGCIQRLVWPCEALTQARNVLALCAENQRLRDTLRISESLRLHPGAAKRLSDFVADEMDGKGMSGGSSR